MVKLTAKGERAVVELTAAVQEIQAGVLDQLGLAEETEFTRLVLTLTKAI